MRFVVCAAIRVRRDQRAFFELHRRAEAASLELADRRFRVELEAVVSEVELKAALRFGPNDGSHTERRLEVANRESQQEPFVLQPQERHVHLAVVTEIADAVERLCTVG